MKRSPEPSSIRRECVDVRCVGAIDPKDNEGIEEGRRQKRTKGK